MPNYKLVNPYIEGSLNTTFSGNNVINVANNVWKKLSKYMTNEVPKFAFTLEESGTGKLRHFKVNEQLSGGGKKANYNITEIQNVSSDKEKQFKKNVTKASSPSKKAMKGGKKDKDEDDDDDSSSSSSDVFSAIKLNKLYHGSYPINYWWYDPWIYSWDSVFIPTLYLTPYIEIATFSYYPY